MKIFTNTLVTLLTFFALTHSAMAIDLQSLETLKKQGFIIQMGELTGAGASLSLNRLAGFIHPSGIVMKKDCTQITIQKGSNTADPKISDVTKVTVDQSAISAQDFEGFFIFK